MPRFCKKMSSILEKISYSSIFENISYSSKGEENVKIKNRIKEMPWIFYPSAPSMQRRKEVAAMIDAAAAKYIAKNN